MSMIKKVLRLCMSFFVLDLEKEENRINRKQVLHKKGDSRRFFK